MMSPEVERKLSTILASLVRDQEDEQAWEALYKLMYPFVWNISKRILWRNQEAAKDATQITFTRVYKYGKFVQYPLPEQFLPYISTVAKRVAWGVLNEEADQSAAGEAAQQEAELHLVSPSQIAKSKWLLEMVLEHVEGEERVIVDLLMEGRTVGEIAQSLGLSYSAAGVRIHRLRRALLTLMLG
jgi:RNA polymerase sigma factor (sigma-70 family)